MLFYYGCENHANIVKRCL